MMNYLLILSYDGTNYCGFQVQPNGRSVAQTFQDGLEAVLHSRPDIKGCSRTDAGVHALGFKLNFHADTRIPAAKLPLALNQHLPPDIRVLDAQVVSEDFHARYAAHTKTYLYRIHNHPIDSPFDAAYYTRVPRHLDEARMQAAAQQFVGRHDFLALCAAGSSAAAHGDTVRTITDCHVTRKGDEVDIEVTADGYLYNMVRILAGTLCEVGAGRMQPDAIPGILASSMFKIFNDFQCVCHCIVTFLPFDINDRTDSTVIMFEFGTIQSMMLDYISFFHTPVPFFCFFLLYHKVLLL